MVKNLRVLILTVLLLLTIAGAANAAESKKFTDMGADNPVLPYVQYLASKNIINGYADGTYHPYAGLTRAEAAVVICKAAGLVLDNTTASSFKDVSSKHWARAYIVTAAKAGYLKGNPDKTFRPEQKLTRAEGISLIFRLSKSDISQAALPNLSDINDKHWAAKPIAAALEAGMLSLSSDGQKFMPDAPFTRINLAQALGILLTKDPSLYKTALPGTLKPITGKITLKKVSDTRETTVDKETKVNVGDVITSVKGAQAELNYPDGSSMLIKDNTQITVKAAEGRKYIKTDGSEGIAVDWLNLDMKKGTMFAGLAARHEGSAEAAAENNGGKTGYIIPHVIASLASLNDDDVLGSLAANTSVPKQQAWYATAQTKKVKVQVDMPWGVAAVRGTFLLINVDETGRANVSCLTGNAEVTSGGQTVPITENQGTQITQQNTPPPPPVPIAPAEVEQFNQVLNWLEQTAAIMDQEQEATAVPTNQTSEKPVTESTVQVLNKALQEQSKSESPSPSHNSSNESSPPTIKSIANYIGVVIEGEAFNLPDTITAVMSDNSSKAVSVKWNTANVDTSKAGYVTISGTVDGYGTVKAILTWVYKLGQPAPVTSGVPINLVGGITIDLGNMTIPPGTTVTVTQAEATNISPELTVGGAVLSICFQNLSVDQPVTLTLPINSGSDASKAGIYYYNDGSWEYQASTVSGSRVTAVINHFSTYGVLLDSTPPASVAITQSTSDGTTISLSFNAADVSGIARYEIYRNGTKIAECTSNSYTDTNVEPGIEYSYQIKAVDPMGNVSPLTQAVVVKVETLAQWDSIDTLPNGLSGLAAGTNKVMAVGPGKAYVSADGISWSALGSQLEADSLLNAAAYGAGQFVAVGTNGSNKGIIYSFNDNGINTVWEKVYDASDWCSGFSSVAFDSSKGFVAIAGNTPYTSSNGTDWNPHSLGVSSYWGFSKVAYGNGVFVAVGYSDTGGGQTTYHPIAYYSSDGTAWNSGALPATDAGAIWWDVIFDGSRFIAAEDNVLTGDPHPGRVYTSTNGRTWTKVGTDLDTANLMRLTYGNQTYLAADSTSYDAVDLYKSLDGTSWVKATTLSKAFSDMIYFNGGFIGVGAQGGLRCEFGGGGTGDNTTTLDTTGNYLDIDNHVLALHLNSSTFVQDSHFDLSKFTITDGTNSCTLASSYEPATSPDTMEPGDYCFDNISDKFLTIKLSNSDYSNLIQSIDLSEFIDGALEPATGIVVIVDKGWNNHADKGEALKTATCLTINGVDGLKYQPVRLYTGYDGQSFGEIGGIACDAAGNIYVPDQAVVKLNPAGDVITSIGGEFSPSCVAVDSSGEHLFIACYLTVLEYVSNDNGLSYAPTERSWIFDDSINSIATDDINLYVFHGNTVDVGRIDDTQGSISAIQLQPDIQPCSIAVSKSNDNYGDVYLADYQNNRVQKYSFGEGWSCSWTCDLNGYSGGLEYLAVDSQGNVLVSDDSNQIFMINDSGELVQSWGTEQLNRPLWIAMDSSNRALVVDGSETQTLIIKYYPPQYCGNPEQLSPGLFTFGPDDGGSSITPPGEIPVNMDSLTWWYSITAASVPYYNDDISKNIDFLQVSGPIPVANANSIIFVAADSNNRVKAYAELVIDDSQIGTGVNYNVKYDEPPGSTGDPGTSEVTKLTITAGAGRDGQIRVKFTDVMDGVVINNEVRLLEVTAGMSVSDVASEICQLFNGDGAVEGYTVTTSDTAVVLFTKDPAVDDREVTISISNPSPIVDLEGRYEESKTVLYFTAPTGATSVKLQMLPPDPNIWQDVDTVETLTAASTKATVAGEILPDGYAFRLVVEGGCYPGISNTFSDFALN